ncbi:type I pantothenate kinase [Lactobacillus colini]|uniref:Pantothenate kinase n=1 Tax=Lactobacillus colini TaxID=1819254 RepID=A0ABS4MEF5_9LACO|nr:type I pantothenate kinase [Lactobacillus colini]MBP2058077.1 type I pantothenate kinase [Lactobacillus colini]
MQSQYLHLAPEKWRNLMPPSDVWQLLVKIINIKKDNSRQVINMQQDLLKQTWSLAPFIISVAGSVSVGKSTFAENLKEKLVENNSKEKVQVVSADSFLMSNDELKAKNLMDEKGFPSSFNWKSLANFLSSVKSGATRVPYRVYSHEISDLSDEVRYITQPDVLIVEGINMLQQAPQGIISPNYFIDFSFYLDADRLDLEEWYMQRFHQMLDINKDNPGNFFYQWAHKPRYIADEFAHEVWKNVNLKNLDEYIAPTKERANMILKKKFDHSFSDIYLRKF